MKRHKCLKATMHRRTYNLINKELHAVCSRCRWHSNFWKSCCDNPFIHMSYTEDGINKPEKLKFENHPNWKMVSKNSKQWMKKKFIQIRSDYPDGRFEVSFGW